MTRLLLAVSGGVDSVVLLDVLAKKGGHELVVAHFDHGIRPDSADDARFVEALARRYKLPFVMRREELGAGASEDIARRRRYEFLRGEALARDMRLVTAHHGDDVIETIAINFARGTGWRGLAVLGATDIARPLLGVTKKEIYHYALEHGLEWVEDSTNRTTTYLRNRLRRVTSLLSPAAKDELRQLRDKQLQLAAEIDAEALRLIGENIEQPRYLFIYADDNTASELLRAAAEGGLTRPQCERALMAVKTARPGTVYEAGGGIKLHFTTHSFIVQVS